MKTFIYCPGFILVSIVTLTGQGNVGIGTAAPSEKLEVGGVIYTNDGGIRFPDQTLQQTAAFNNNGPQDAGAPQGKVYMTLEGVSIPDTIDLLEMSSGGVLRVAAGAALNPQTFKIIKAPDKVSPQLLMLTGMGTVISKVRFHFLDAENILYHTIELRSAAILQQTYKDLFIGNGQFAHLETLEFTYVAIENKSIQPGPDPCYCWSFQTGSSCTCD